MVVCVVKMFNIIKYEYHMGRTGLLFISTHGAPKDIFKKYLKKASKKSTKI